MTTWIISDTHFGDGGLIGTGLSGGKTARAFDTLADMDECLADNWSDHIGAGDTVLHLGDVYAGDGWAMLPKLTGRKHLILGNHDDPLDGRLGSVFETISLWKLDPDRKLVLTHLPIDLSARSGLGDRFALNIHGHLHSKPAPTPRHVCVCVEQTAYRPVNLEDLLATRTADNA